MKLLMSLPCLQCTCIYILSLTACTYSHSLPVRTPTHCLYILPQLHPFFFSVISVCIAFRWPLKTNCNDITSTVIYPAHPVPPVKRRFEKVLYTNLPELMRKASAHLASALKWFEKVRGGSLRLNHPELAHRYPTHLVPPVKERFEKVQSCRTTLNSCKRPLHTLLSLH